MHGKGLIALGEVAARGAMVRDNPLRALRTARAPLSEAAARPVMQRWAISCRRRSAPARAAMMAQIQTLCDPYRPALARRDD